ncbi:O-acetyl-ADP-ribose deacetylase (regulator of RNase III) [Methylobacterium brachiatum]|jgi:O-acetyl-ADP-ribose deacetylase (regulator of RNase III)|uniref:O-acetyl-ADP-ribose deacetylase (Regulator of RNase III) n=1 Tax=Methylobacterium brachiatum TaxID=269660 RepID=A0AAJ1WXU8_9HYPH|nr:macro domain-containing protein [Methylobacterium brachiatum]MCB4805632.1 macro domain-containing protein [Methylobacterium brachiatum]MDQ0546974.1 O-acetyl-ADP-ribose deacetylase (regulator of RNase III) [Methylobacterium brachiatum]
MITYLRTSLFESPAQTLVNTVNTVGVMGKGIAKEFKDRYPAMYAEYRRVCMNGELTIGRLQLWRGNDHWILNFPTKTTWRQPSKIAYLERGLETFSKSYKQMGISSVAFPPLGCGNGNLDWWDVKPLMENFLQPLEITVYIHDRQVPVNFVPEHIDGVHETPAMYEAFVGDVIALVASGVRKFSLSFDGTEFYASANSDAGIEIRAGDRRVYIQPDYMEWAWSALQSGVLTLQQFPSQDAREAAQYLFSLLIHLPYVQAAEISKPRWGDEKIALGLYFKRKSSIEGRALLNLNSNADAQLCLSQSW